MNINHHTLTLVSLVIEEAFLCENSQIGTSQGSGSRMYTAEKLNLYRVHIGWYMELQKCSFTNHTNRNSCLHDSDITIAKKISYSVKRLKVISSKSRCVMRLIFNIFSFAKLSILNFFSTRAGRPSSTVARVKPQVIWNAYAKWTKNLWVLLGYGYSLYNSHQYNKRKWIFCGLIEISQNIMNCYFQKIKSKVFQET